jgi:hypothetical protein
MQNEIAATHHSRRYDVWMDGQEYPASTGNNFLHPHFCLNADDHKLAWHEGVSDINDAVSQHLLLVFFCPLNSTTGDWNELSG